MKRPRSLERDGVKGDEENGRDLRSPRPPWSVRSDTTFDTRPEPSMDSGEEVVLVVGGETGVFSLLDKEDVLRDASFALADVRLSGLLLFPDVLDRLL